MSTPVPLTFADVFVFQPEPPLDLLVWVPDGAGLLKAVDGFLDVMVAELVQQGHKIPTRRRPVEGVQGVAEGYGETDTAKDTVRTPRQAPGLPGRWAPKWTSRVAHREPQSWLGLPGECFHFAKSDLSFAK